MINLKNMKNILLKFMALAFASIAVSSCYKDSAGLGGAGINVVSIPTYTNIYSYALVAGTQSFSILQINRDVPNSTVLNTSQTVTIKLDNSVITAYNTANGTAYIPLATTAFAFDAANPLNAGNITLTYAPGEFSKNIVIKLDLTQLPAGSNALGFTITATSAGVISGGSFQGFVAIGAKNAWQANYAVTGFFFHPSAPRAIAATKTIGTVGPTRCVAQHSDLYTSNYMFQFDVSGTSLVNYSAAGATPAVPASGFMTADNPGGFDLSAALPDAPGVTYTQTKYNNTYDDVNKIFWMHYGYGGGSTSQTGFSRQVYEKWVRQ